MKKYICALLCTVLVLSLTHPVFAAAPELTREAAGAILQEKGVYQGNGAGDLMLDKGLTRGELAAVLTRLHGEGQVDPNMYAWACYFDDVPDWAKPYVGYCTANLLVKGYGNGRYGSGDPVTPAAACTVVLRLYGYADGEGGAWTYETACGYAVSLGLIGEGAVRGQEINRGDMAVLICAAMQKEQEAPSERFSTQAEGVTFAADGTVTGKTITQADWSREDFSQEANPAIFRGDYTRGWYNALRQSIVDREAILAGNNEQGFHPKYLYAHTTVDYETDSFHNFSDLLRHLQGFCYYHVGGEPYTVNPYEFPGYITVEVSPGWPSEDVLRFIEPELDAISGLSDRDKVIALNDYLCDLMAYGQGSGGLEAIFSEHTEPALGVCANYATAFSLLCGAAGIPSMIVSSDDHGWNEVYVDGQWLTVDVTFNDASYHRNAYLLSTDAPRTDIMPQGTRFVRELLAPGSTK